MGSGASEDEEVGKPGAEEAADGEEEGGEEENGGADAVKSPSVGGGEELSKCFPDKNNPS